MVQFFRSHAWIVATLWAAMAAPAAARPPVLNPPLACDIAQGCYIQNHLDTDPGPGAADFSCGLLSYDGHRGTDFAVQSLGDMDKGVDVLAPAPGQVLGIRDELPDIAFNAPGAPDVSGRECGNGVALDHGGGWVTQLCHMKRGSIQVQPGQRVSKGHVLGQVGLSGQTEFPHVHLSVRQDGRDIDPFNPSGVISCDSSDPQTLWQAPLGYVGTGVFNAGIDTSVPEYGALLQGPAPITTLSPNAPALVVWALAFGARTGDVMRFELDGPDGPIHRNAVTLDKDQARYFRASGLRAQRPWPKGTYVGTITINRDGAEVAMRKFTFEIK